MSPALAGGFLTTVPPGKPSSFFIFFHITDWVQRQHPMNHLGCQAILGTSYLAGCGRHL